ncbi:AarF/ABC1/UbiB kinase family protein [Planomicrobium sp. YIM 101495]|uniref:ABC1 kinase family protein n=1 Tax=Planomicrobium sp. YIM 101495 TaxID=2665160 RepID=UPI0012B96794|nr:AarF/UbiB family protein [Planomicrobium sp. YIM 101495]MTD29866.1 AarF/ABC1/UbiB kinase family protein [Planomicrobium sp. YIM 101495]
MDLIKVLVVAATIGIFIYFVSGRLIGPKINFKKRILSVSLGVTLTTFVYWYSYLRDFGADINQLATSAADGSLILWIGSMLLITMLLYLFFELFDPVEISDSRSLTGIRNPLKRLQKQWRLQKRLRQILQIAVRNGVSTGLKYARRRENDRDLAIGFRKTLEEAGGVFIKFGQVLSTRTELFSPVFIEELASLQQNVPPLAPEDVKKILEKRLPLPKDEIFSHFDLTPLAAGSIGQVHKAVLVDKSQDVVVKLLYPHVREYMRDDLGMLVEFADWMSEKSTWAEHIGFRELARGFAAGFQEEVDFRIEARNTKQVANALSESEFDVRIPTVYEQYSGEGLLVLEYVVGKSIAKGGCVFEQHGVDPNGFARNVLFSFFEQMMFSGIFHADPHPGNIFIDEKDGKPILLDFGAVGRLADSQQHALNLFIIGVQQNDPSVLYDAVMGLVEDKGEVDRHRFEQSIGQILLRISYVDRIPTKELVHDMFDVVQEFGLSFYPSVGMALRSLITLDLTLRFIDRDFDMFSEAKVFAKKYKTAILKKPFTEPLATKTKIEEELALLIPEALRLPKRIDQLIQRVESGKIILHHDIFSDKKNSSFVLQLFSRLVLLLTGITFGVISVALLAISLFLNTAYAIYLNTAAYAGLFLCVVLLVRLSIQAIRDVKRNS